MSEIFTGILNFIIGLPGGEAILIICLSLLTFLIYYKIFHLKDFKTKLSEDKADLRSIISNRDSKIRELEEKLQNSDSEYNKLCDEMRHTKTRYEILKNQLSIPQKTYNQGE